MSPAAKRELSETEVAEAIRAVARAIGVDTIPGEGGSVTEAVAGLTASLDRIGDAVADIAAAMREGRAAHSDD